MKIYVVGPVGSGKSTLAKRISKELDILYVELDSVIWNNDINFENQCNFRMKKIVS